VHGAPIGDGGGGGGGGGGAEDAAATADEGSGGGWWWLSWLGSSRRRRGGISGRLVPLTCWVATISSFLLYATIRWRRLRRLVP
jgi:hypothetical protein